MKDILIGIAYRTDEFKLIPFEKENINYEIFSPKNETDYSKYDGFCAEAWNYGDYSFNSKKE